LGSGDHLSTPRIGTNMWVPVDDQNCMVYTTIYSFGDDPLSDEERTDLDWRNGRGPGERTADFRKVRNPSNDWLIDRQVQKMETFTGIEGINTQDHAVTESMGAIADRTGEHLGTTDKAIVAARLLLFQALKKVEMGSDPPGLGKSYYGIRALQGILPERLSWREAFKDRIDSGSGNTR
jgi:hypothetical protein